MNPFWKSLWVAVVAVEWAAGQRLSIGIEGGMPLTAIAQSSGCWGCGGVDINRYSAGLTGEVHLYRRFSLEVEGLLQRIHADYYVGVPHFPVYTEGRVAGYVWEFPLVLRYSVRRSMLSPFADAGSTIRHVGQMHGPGSSYANWYAQNPEPVQIDFDPGKPFGVGVSAGVGVAKKAGPFRLVPELRYTRWTEGFYQPNRNEVQLFVGIVFP